MILYDMYYYNKNIDITQSKIQEYKSIRWKLYSQVSVYLL